MGLLGVVSWSCISCDPWGLAVGLGQLIPAGAVAGLLVGAAHGVVGRLGVVGQYALGVVAAWSVLVIIDYLSPFVRGSFFDLGAGPLEYSVVSLILGTVATFELRRRYGRAREQWDRDNGSAAPALPWLQTVSFARQTSFACVSVLLAASASAAWNTYLAPSQTAEDFTQDMRGIVAANPNDAQAHYFLARGLMELRVWEEALPVAQRALELDSSVVAHHETVGWALIGTGQSRLALPHFWRAAELAPTDPRLWRDLARVARLVGENEDALAAYQHLSELTPVRILWPKEDREAWEELQRQLAR